VLCHIFTNKLDLDGWKIQRYSHRNIPQKTMPVIYNTWLYRFDKINYEDISRQIPKASELGCEYFVIDAGWFGNGDANWMFLRGDWKENRTAKLCGKMKTLADEVRANKMKFGFWLETESAGCNSEIVKNHPDWFICDAGLYYLDFTNKEASDAMFETVCGLVDYYGAEFMKFDYNQDLFTDKTLTSFCDYNNCYAEYVKRIRKKYPELYLQCCASGGMRTDLTNCMLFDSYWLSDDQSPFEGLRLVKETIKRLAPQRLERWACLTSFASTQPVPQDKILTIDDWSWERLAVVHESYLKAFLTGAPIGFSCDLTLLSNDTFALLKNIVCDFKNERDSYWANAEMRILCDTKSMLILQYSNPDLTDVRVQVISAKCRQRAVTVYPILDMNTVYHCSNGTEATGKEYSENGICAPVYDCFLMKEVRFYK